MHVRPLQVVVLLRAAQYCVEYIFISSPGCLESRVKIAVMSLVALYFSRYCIIRSKMFYFLCLCFVCYLCEKY